jgi:hypothetical protein
MSGRGAIAVPLALVIGLGLASPAAAAAAADTVTLNASRTALEFGQSSTLSGAIEPAAGGQTVDIVDAAAPTTVLASTTTNGAGQYSVEVAPERNVDVRARWGAALSAPVPLRVRPRLTAHLQDVRLFGDALVSGRLEPAHPGQRVQVALLRGDAVVAREDAVLDGSAYEAELPVLRPVKVLEQRLRDLAYHVPKPNRGFDHRTADAVLAFHKVQGMSRVRSVTGATWKRLSKPRTPKPRAAKPNVHIEIDQSKQVLYVVRQGEIDEIVHTSTGAGGATRDGVFHVFRKIAGYSPNRLYYPSYFDGGRAVHGWPQVPAYPASHGCSRVPYWTATFLHRIMGYGMEVRVYH